MVRVLRHPAFVDDAVVDTNRDPAAGPRWPPHALGKVPDPRRGFDGAGE